MAFVQDKQELSEYHCEHHCCIHQNSNQWHYKLWETFAYHISHECLPTIFHSVSWGVASSQLARLADFPGLHMNACCALFTVAPCKLLVSNINGQSLRCVQPKTFSKPSLHCTAGTDFILWKYNTQLSALASLFSMWGLQHT
jgi:hypothetical protein